MNKRERNLKKMKQELGITNQRGATFVGLRPAIMESKKYNKKISRREGKSICSNY